MNFKMDTFLKSGLTILMVLVLGSFAYAQRTVKGKVTDAASGESLIGANVVAKGTTSGGVTDIDGMYSISIPAGSSAIEISYAGYETQTITLGTSNTVDVALKAGRVLEDVVVVGYGSVKKSDATGAVAAITEKDFNKGVINSPEQLMQGRIAGVQVAASSGEPGGAISIRIRGTSSVRAGNNPLFVIDGVPLAADNTSAGGSDASFGTSTARNPLNFLNPDDIASIDVLKDASATAIYGSRGANGVVLITTKKGKEGKGTVDYGYSIGFSQITKKYDLLNKSEFLGYFEKKDGAAEAKKRDLLGDTDWQDAILQTGIAHNHNISFGGGNGNSNYRFSFGYLNQDGIVKTSGIKRYNARINAETKGWNDRLKMGVQLTASNVLDRNVPISENAGYEGDLMGNVFKANPTAPIYQKDGKSFTQNDPENPNPVAMIEYSRDRTKTIRAMGNVNAELKIMDGLSFKTILGTDRSLSSRTQAYSGSLVARGITGKGRLYDNNVTSNNTLWENYFTYDKKFSKISFNALAGYSYQRFDYTTNGYEMTNFRTKDLDLMINNRASLTQKAEIVYDYYTQEEFDKKTASGADPFDKALIGKIESTKLSGGSNTIIATNSVGRTDELQSYFGRVNFNINEKYLLTASLRADGSTRFGGDNQYGYFPSFAAKWRLIQESFIPKGIFSDLGLRVGYGVTGNQELPYNQYSTRTRYADWDIDVDGNVQNGANGEVAFRNSGLKWETTSALNIGVDFGFANNRVSGSLELYNKNTTDLLIKVDAAQPASQPFVFQNLDANVINKGVELSLNVVAVKRGSFSWNIAGNVAYNKNKIENYNGFLQTGRINGQGLSGAYAQAIANDQPLFAYYLRPFDGYDGNGVSKYVDDFDAQKFLDGKSPLPVVTGGLTNSVSYKGLDLTVFFNGVFGNYIYSNTANAFFTKGSLNNGRNVTADVLTSEEGALNAPDVSTRFLEKGDFVRLSNLTLGYNLPKFAGLSGVRIYVTGQNLMTFTKYSGQDPEVNTNKQINDVPSFGIDYTAYPRARTWLVGANVSF
jgi:iron complex outermembrane receptor protein